MPLDHRPIALLNSAYKLFTKILSFRVRSLLSQLVLPAQVGFNTKRSIHTALDIVVAVRKAANLDSDLHREIILLLDFAKAYDTLQRPYLLSALTGLGCHPTLYPSWQHYNATPRAVLSSMDIARFDVPLLV